MKPHNRLPQFQMQRFGLALLLPAALMGAIVFPTQLQTATAQTPQTAGQPNRQLYISGREQQYNSKTQVATIRGDVEMVYPARGIQATAAQAQYFTRERQIILSGNVYVLQKGGNSIKAETVTYLIDEGRFVATPKNGGRVESIYIINETNQNQGTPAPTTPPLKKN